MNYIEKAIEEYAKEGKEGVVQFAMTTWQMSVAQFAVKVWQIGVDGKCPGDILCRTCPMNMAFMSDTSLDKHCGNISFEERRELVLSNVKE